MEYTLIVKKKVGIITFHFVNNFGGALQAYALYKTVTEKCSADAEIIDYRNWFIRFTDIVRLFPITTNISEFVSGLKTMKQRVGRRTRFGNFTKRTSNKSRKYLNYRQILSNLPNDDKYICGSDQIWNPVLTMGVSPSYFLAFEKDSNNKIAYAPSFGTDGVPKVFEKRIGKYLKNFTYLSVREKSGQRYIAKLTGQTADRLIDPTFLLTKEEWGQIGTKHYGEEPYILLYIMQRDEEVYKYAYEIKKRLGYKLVEISRYGYNPGFVDNTLVDVGPEEFISLFRDAAYICTNSYHGLAYSLIFEKKFCLIPCKKFTARIDNMVDLLNIEVASDSRASCLTSNYDVMHVRDIIESEKQKAISYLNKSLN